MSTSNKVQLPSVSESFLYTVILRDKKSGEFQVLAETDSLEQARAVMEENWGSYIQYSLRALKVQNELRNMKTAGNNKPVYFNQLCFLSKDLIDCGTHFVSGKSKRSFNGVNEVTGRVDKSFSSYSLR